VTALLAEMKASLIVPYCAEITFRDSIAHCHADPPIVRRCAIVADDSKGAILAYDPDKHEFLLARRGREGLESFGVMGDAVGCFMAR